MNRDVFINQDEYTKYLQEHKEDLFFQVIEKIREAYENEIEEAVVQNVTIIEDSAEYKIYFERNQWQAVVQTSLESLRDTLKIDDLLDGYLFLKKLEDSKDDL